MHTDDLTQLLDETMQLNVLYVEDDEETRRHTLKMLHNFFSDIAVEVNGIKGFETFKTGSFDVIFTDINMPDMSGIEMIKNIRISNKEIPIVIFSAHDEVDYFLNSIKLGIDGYILKPFQYAAVEEIIMKIVDKISRVRKSHNFFYLSKPFYWDTKEEVLYKGGVQIKLTKNELALFRLLSSRHQTIYSPVDIEIYVFDDDTSDARRVRNLLSRLKNKLQYELIESIYAEGYRFKK